MLARRGRLPDRPGRCAPGGRGRWAGPVRGRLRAGVAGTRGDRWELGRRPAELRIRDGGERGEGVRGGPGPGPPRIGDQRSDERGHRGQGQRRLRDRDRRVGTQVEQPGVELLGAGPVRGVLAHRLLDERAQAVLEPVECGRFVHGPEQQPRRRAAAERVAAGPGVDEDPAPGEHVRRGGGLLAPSLLGRHEGRRPQLVVRAVAVEIEPGGGVQGTGDAEVDDLGAEPGQQNVGRFEVAVHDAGPMDGHQGGRHAHRELVQLRRAQWAASRHRLGERRTVDELGDQVRLLGVDVNVEDRGGAEPGHPAGVVGLLLQPRPELGETGKIRPDQLDGHLPAGRVHPQVDRAHAARPEPAQQPVGADLGRFPGARPGTTVVRAIGGGAVTGWVGHRCVTPALVVEDAGRRSAGG